MVTHLCTLKNHLHPTLTFNILIICSIYKNITTPTPLNNSVTFYKRKVYFLIYLFTEVLKSYFINKGEWSVVGLILVKILVLVLVESEGLPDLDLK